MSRLRAAPWFAAATLLVAGCSSPSPAAPALHVERTHRAGRALGETPADSLAPRQGLDVDPAAALRLSIEWHWLPSAPDDGLLPIGVHALAVAGSGGDDPFSAAPLIVGSVRVAFGEAARRVSERLAELPTADSTRLARQSEALPVGVTAVLAPGPLALELSRPTTSSGVELALVRDGEVPLSAVREADSGDEGTDESESHDERAGSATPVAWREVVLLDTNLLPDGPPGVIALPGGGPGTWLVAVIEVRSAPTEGEALAQHAALLAQCLTDVADSAVHEQAQARAVDAAESKQRQLLAAARSMAAAGDRRRAGVFLASESGASLALDTVLVADEAALESLGAAWRQAAGADDDRLVQGDTLGWSIERTTALWLAQRADGTALPAELESVLLRQTGVVARSPGLLQQFAQESDGLAAWRAHLEQENRLSLEDSLPAARVRAYDWLMPRGLVPPGYDPLAPRAERQAALLAADEAP